MYQKRAAAVLIGCGCLLAASSAQAEEPAGRVLWLYGNVERVGPEGAVRVLEKGDAVLQGEVIRAGPSSHAQLLMSDEALLAVRPDSSLRLETYRYKGAEDGSERSVIEVLKGGLRSITGAVGRKHKENYLIRSNSHLIGIRGTDHETFVTEEGTYNRVTEGGTYLQSPAGRLDLAPGQLGFASLLPNLAPARMERTPDFMHIAAQRGGGNTGPLPRESASIDRVQPIFEAQVGGPGLAVPGHSAGGMGARSNSTKTTGGGWGAGGRTDPVSGPGQGSDQGSGHGRGFGKGGRPR